MCREVSWTKCIIPSVFKRWKNDGPFKPNWYLPVHLGGYGMGLDLSPSTWNVTRNQRQMARLFLERKEVMLFRTLSNDLETGRLLQNPTFRKLLTANLKFNFRQPNRPLNSHETLENPWLERLTMAKRCSEAGGRLPSVGVPVLNKQLSYEFQDYRPLKFSSLESCWDMNFYSIKGPVVPDLNEMNLKMKMNNAKENTVNRIGGRINDVDALAILRKTFEDFLIREK